MEWDNGGLGETGEPVNGIPGGEFWRQKDLERDVGENRVCEGAGEMEVVCVTNRGRGAR